MLLNYFYPLQNGGKVIDLKKLL